jgi:hypothetical protein
MNKKTKEMNLQLFVYLMFILFDIFLNEIKFSSSWHPSNGYWIKHVCKIPTWITLFSVCYGLFEYNS